MNASRQACGFAICLQGYRGTANIIARKRMAILKLFVATDGAAPRQFANAKRHSAERPNPVGRRHRVFDTWSMIRFAPDEVDAIRSGQISGAKCHYRHRAKAVCSPIAVDSGIGRNANRLPAH